MTTAIISTVIGSLIIISIVLSLKIAQLSHRLKLSDKENENIRKANSESESNFKKEISELEKKQSELIGKHKKEILNMNNVHKKEISKLQPSKLATSPKGMKTISKHIKEVLNPSDENS